ncbi:MAG: hypothetical protein PHD67_00790 [Oscillospiraceae bacterium]|nr:hypothetical protein [Oscillospiraceae bacterium]
MNGKAHVGTATILTVFMVLCLSIFGVLSVVSAQADLKLAQKTGEAVRDYYAADARGEEDLARVDAILKAQLEETQGQPGLDDLQRASLKLTQAGFTANLGEEGLLISWSEEAGEGQTLEIELAAPLSPSSVRWDIRRWQLVRTAQEEEEDFGVDLWDGVS